MALPAARLQLLSPSALGRRGAARRRVRATAAAVPGGLGSLLGRVAIVLGICCCGGRLGRPAAFTASSPSRSGRTAFASAKLGLSTRALKSAKPRPVPPVRAALAGDSRAGPRVAAAASEAAEASTKSKYFTGISWYLAHFVVGISNDGIMKYLGGSFAPFQIVFLRFLSAAAVLLPVLALKGSDAFKTSRMWMHIVRGILLALGIGLWCRGLTMMPFASCVVINNTMPFFKMLFAMFFLGEKVGKERWLASVGGFVGCLIVFNPTAATFKPESLVLLLSAMCFAMLDIFNKKYSESESVVPMLFYGSLATALVASVRAWQTWAPVSVTQGGFFLLLGVGANLLLYCLLRAFRYVDASATCPYRYMEFVLSAVAGFLVFHEKPTLATLLGSCIILPSVVYCAMIETRE